MLYTFHFGGFLIGYEGQPILPIFEPRVLVKEIARDRQARKQALDLWTGLSRVIGKLVFLLARGLVKVVPGQLGRWLAGAPDRWADRAFQHLVNHAQRMLVRNLTEQAWQRAQLAKAGREKARKRLQAALAENAKRAAQIRETLARLPGEYERRMKTRHEATQERLKAQLKNVDERLAEKNWGRKRLGARQARLKNELERVEQAAAGVAAPPLSQGRYLRRAVERHQAKSARLGAALDRVNAQLADARAAGDQDRARALEARRDKLQARHDAVGSRAGELQRTPGAAGAPAGMTLPELWTRPWVRWTVRAAAVVAAVVAVVVLLTLPAGAVSQTAPNTVAGGGWLAVASGVTATVAGLVVAGAAVLAVLRSKWSPRQIRAPTRAGINTWARAVRSGLTAFWLVGIAGLELALGITAPLQPVAASRLVRHEWPIQWTASYWVAAFRFQVGVWAGRLWHNTKLVTKLAFTPAGAVYIAVAAVFVIATGGQMVWALPAISAMVTFQVRGSLNTFMRLLSQNVWVQRGVLAAILASLSVNIPHHIRGMRNAAAPDSSQWIHGLFGVGAVTTVIGAVAMLGALFTTSNPAEVKFTKWWDRFTDRAGTLGAAATFFAIPFMIYAVIFHPRYDGVVTIHPVVFALVVATFTGYGGEALLHLIGKIFQRTLPEKLTRFFAVYSAATIAAYGMIYQLHQLPVLIVVTGTLTLGGLLHLVLTRPHLSRAGKTGHAVAATMFTLVNALAAAALFLGWPGIPAAAAVTVAALGVAVTAVWAWTIRGPPAGWLVRFQDTTKNWLGQSRAWLATKLGAVTQPWAQAWARPWVRWTVRAGVVVAVVVAVVVLLILPVGAVSQTAPSTVAGGGWLAGAVAGVVGALLPAGPVVVSVLLVVRGLSWWRWRGQQKRLSECSTCSKSRAWTRGWSTPKTSSTCPVGPKPTGWTRCGWPRSPNGR